MFLLVHRFELIYIFCCLYRWQGSNLRHLGPKPRTLPTELHLYIWCSCEIRTRNDRTKTCSVTITPRSILIYIWLLVLFCFDDAKVRIIFELPKLFRAFNIVLTFWTVDSERLELSTSWLWVNCSDRLSYESETMALVIQRKPLCWFFGW